jgi:fermentation-respiration switch protein FrsA (DUF1100 family)
VPALPIAPKSGKRSNLLSVFVGLFSIVFGGCQSGGRAWVQQKLMYFPTRDITRTPAFIPLPFEEVRLKTEDGIGLHAWFIPHAKSGRVVLICHGNGGNIGHRIDLCELLHDAGLNVFLFDYRGFGRSEARPDELGTYSDAFAAYDWLREKGFADKQILLLGESLGGAVAADLAARTQPGGLILQSTFTSMTAIGRQVYFFLPVGWLCTFKYDTLSKLGRIHCPVLIMHGRSDKLIPFQHAEKLFAAANEPKLLRELPGNHNTALGADPAIYTKAVADFLKLLGP